MERIGDRVPVLRAPIEAEPRGDRGEPLAAGPAHRGGMGVNALPAAIFPDAGIRHEGFLRGPVAERFEQTKQTFVARPRQAAVEEHRHGGEDDAAIGIVLHLTDRGIADAHRAVAAVACRSGAIHSSIEPVGTTL